LQGKAGGNIGIIPGEKQFEDPAQLVVVEEADGVFI
jgi:hypothetical protein